MVEVDLHDILSSGFCDQPAESVLNILGVLVIFCNFMDRHYF
jgi:hypothetical protein